MPYCRRHAKLKGVYYDGHTQPISCINCHTGESIIADSDQAVSVIDILGTALLTEAVIDTFNDTTSDTTPDFAAGGGDFGGGGASGDY